MSLSSSKVMANYELTRSSDRIRGLVVIMKKAMPITSIVLQGSKAAESFDASFNEKMNMCFG